MHTDEPPVLLGQNRAPNTVEHVLHALAACLTGTIAYHAAARGIALDGLETTIHGDLDLGRQTGLPRRRLGPDHRSATAHTTHYRPHARYETGGVATAPRARGLRLPSRLMSTSLACPSGSAPIADAACLGTVLGIWAHPDDEAFLSAGLMAAARDAGNRVVCVTATLGERGTDDPEGWPPSRLGAVREHELRASLAALDVTEHHMLGLADGALAAQPADVITRRLDQIINIVSPDTIITFGPDGMTGHQDRRTVST